MRLSLKRNAAWMFLGQSGYALSQWLIVVVLAHLGGPAMVGQFTLALAIVGPIIIFSRLQMATIQVVDATGRYAFTDYLAVRLATTGPALLVIAAIAVLAGYSTPVVAVIMAVGFARAVEGLSDIYYGFAQRRERLDRVAQSMLLRGGIGCAALGLVFALTGSLSGALLAQATVWVAVWWLFDRRIVPTGQRWQRQQGDAAAAGGRAPDGDGALRRRLRLAWVGVPLGGTLLLGALNINIPRYTIEGFVGLEALGIFAGLAHFVIAGRLVVDAVCQAASPRLANLFARGDVAGFRRLMLGLLGIGLLLGLTGLLAVLLFGAPLLGLVYGPAFAAHAELLAWIMVVGLVSYTAAPFGYGLTAMQRFRVQPVVYGLVVGVNLLACLLLVPRYGLMGAVGGWLLALACQGLIGLGLNAHYLQRATGKPAAGAVYPL